MCNLTCHMTTTPSGSSSSVLSSLLCAAGKTTGWGSSGYFLLCGDGIISERSQYVLFYCSASRSTHTVNFNSFHLFILRARCCLRADDVPHSSLYSSLLYSHFCFTIFLQVTASVFILLVLLLYCLTSSGGSIQIKGKVLISQISPALKMLL